MNGDVFIITGAGSGIGRATAVRLAREHVRMALVGRTAAKLEAAAREVTDAGGEASVHALDLADKRAAEAMVEQVVDRYGTVDVLVNGAGDTTIHRRLLSTEPEDIRATVDSHLLATIYCTQAVLPVMTRSRRGTILNIASTAGVQPAIIAGFAYSAVKAAVINFTEFLEVEYRNSGIRACVILPGEVDTPLLDKRPISPDSTARDLMLGADDVAELIAFIVRVPRRATIPYVVIRPSMHRDVRRELEPIDREQP